MSRSHKHHHPHDHSGLKLSVFLSALCLVHCLTFPFLIALLPMVNIAFHPPEWIEFTLLGATAALGLYSMRHGISMHYHKFTPLIIFLIGIIGAFSIHIIWHTHELNWYKVALEVFFALLIAMSQVINYRWANTYACTVHNH
ncbi:MAG: MerC domain-containing protein [Bacteroidetes bacterium]|nr:MerC domain-containing protein [Bacteroidota bacterium]